jgi:hypothetical protein
MTVRRIIERLVSVGFVAAAVAATSVSIAGCSSGGSAKVAKVQAGDMPDGAEWTGVYYSELYGHLHLVHEGTVVSGKWMRPVKDRWGELSGQVTGDVIRFEWTEHTIGSVGPKSARKGKGYFKYKRPEGDNVDDIINGEIGIGGDEVGEPWEAVKQRNQKPDLASIGGTGSTDIGGGDWDKGNSESGTPEAPKTPSEAAPPPGI